MLQISRKTDYGLLFLAYLAKFYDIRFVSLAEVSRINHLPLAYLRQIALILHKEGLLVSKEGLGGGYSLAKAPAQITMAEVMQILEGSIAPVACLEKDNHCIAEDVCSTKKLWTVLYGDMVVKFQTTTLNDIM